MKITRRLVRIRVQHKFTRNNTPNLDKILLNARSEYKKSINKMELNQRGKLKTLSNYTSQTKHIHEIITFQNH